MMLKTCLVLLVVCALIVPDVDAWRRRRRRRFWRRVGRIVRTVGRIALDGAVDAVLSGKRSMEESGEDLSPQDMDSLAHNCPLLGLDDAGLQADLVQSAFTDSDENQDGALTGEEMDSFVNIMQAISMCENMAETDDGQQ